MTIAEILYTILIEPLQLFFEILYMNAYKVIGSPGMSIVVLSLAMNFLVLPLYKRADAMQEEERNTEQKLHRGVQHIKKTFKGDEKMMILQTYYRQNGYKPAYVFKGAFSLFLEIPFFIAAYQFLSHLQVIQGVPFGVIQDLGAPDGLITIGGTVINLLPIVMTGVNLVSCVIFTRDYPLKTKIQLYSMAVFFFFFLYNSPAGLVFYWTLNNVFSLVKTIFYKLKNAKKILKVMAAAAGAALLAAAARMHGNEAFENAALTAVVGVILLLPVLLTVIRRRGKVKLPSAGLSADGRFFETAKLFMVLLIGCVIPASVIKASPQEFVDVFYFKNPMWYIGKTLCLTAGVFLVWIEVFYRLADKSRRVYWDIAMWLMCGIAATDYMFFGKNLGILSNTLKYENGLNLNAGEQWANIGILCLLCAVMYVLFVRGRKVIPQALLAGTAALAVLSGSYMVSIRGSVSEIKTGAQTGQEGQALFSLSRTGKNVIVLMMDRAMGEYIPYIFNEKPELKDIYAGFTYYPNTVSFGGFTNYASPALFGGYEYTPAEMNKRNKELLKDKHNEALKVMPVLFDQNGYEVTVCDPTYANYRWVPDLSIYKDYPDIDTYITTGRYTDVKSKENTYQNTMKNFFCYSVMKTLPLCMQPVAYDKGNYNHEESISGEQTLNSLYTSSGISSTFAKCYAVLENLNHMTEITDEDKNTFLMMSNDTAHEPMMLQEPAYVPAENVNNTDYEEANQDRFTVDGVTLRMENAIHYIHYQSNMAAILKIGEWLQYLKASGVYDNTRIILVSDHGRWLEQLEERILDKEKAGLYDTESYYPLLMVKDFNSREFSVSEEFMTNADVPTLAAGQLIENPQNPFTGKAINNDEKYAHDQYILAAEDWDTSVNNGYTFLPGTWFAVHSDSRSRENWSIINPFGTLPTQQKRE